MYDGRGQLSINRSIESFFSIPEDNANMKHVLNKKKMVRTCSIPFAANSRNVLLARCTYDTTAVQGSTTYAGYGITLCN